MKSRLFYGDLLISLIIFVLLAIFIPITIKLPSSSIIFPIILIVCLGFLNIILLISSINKFKAIKGKETDTNIIKWEDIKSPLLVFVLTVIYVFLFARTNYFFSTAIYMIALMKYFKVKSLKTIIITTLVFNIVIYVGFSKLLNVPLM